MEDFFGCSIRVKKKTIQINNKKDFKRTYAIQLTSNKERKRQIKEIDEKKERETLDVLKLFIKIFGGKSNFTEINKREEDKVEQERMINKLPLKQSWHTPIVKKVYNEKNVEFSDPVYAANYFVNRGLEDVAPEIKEHLDLLWQGVKGIIEVNKSTADTFSSFATNFLPIHKEHAVNIKSHTRVLKGISKSFNKFNTLLSQKKLGEFL